MKQAILITAYTDWSQLELLVSQFSNKFNIYIHIDKKVQVPQYIEEKLGENPNVKFIGQLYIVNWGGMHHVDAIIALSKIALNDKENAFFHLISGNDIRTATEETFFGIDMSYCYMEIFMLPNDQWQQQGMDRFLLFHPLDRLDIRSQRQSEIYYRYIKWQTFHKVRRQLPKSQLYGGSTWWSMNRLHLTYIIDNINKDGLYNALQNTFVPEESLFPSIIMNSQYSYFVYKNNLRYIDWNYRNNNIPAILDESDFEKIEQSQCLFARKINSEYSSKLIRRIISKYMA